MKARTIKQTNILVPIGANVDIKYTGDNKFSLIHDNKWYGEYDFSCFKAVERLQLNSINTEYFQVIGQINQLAGFNDNNYTLIADNELLLYSLFN